jgi:tRNA dimethylallyltransferase
LVGPTATGKTAIAVRILERMQGTIVSADARQVYRFLDIGTSKPSPDLGQRVAFAMIDLITPEQRYSAADFARDARTVVRGLLARHVPFMLVGGSGLYLKALFQPFFNLPPGAETLRTALVRLPTAELYQELEAIDPETARRLHPHDRQRIMRALEVFEATGRTLTQFRTEPGAPPEFEPIYVGLDFPRTVLRRRIETRFDEMIARGLKEEVSHLTRMGYDTQVPALNAIGYREIVEHLNGRLTLEEAVNTAKRRSLAYAKRQMTWFRHQPGIVWIDAQDREFAFTQVERLFRQSLAGT